MKLLLLLLCTYLIKKEVTCLRFETDASLPEDAIDFDTDSKIWTETGNAAAEDQFPWQVGITLLNMNWSGTNFCSGSLISLDWVLTAARCVVGVGNLELKFGNINLTFYEQIQYSKNYTVHPFYSEWVLGGEKMSMHNIALVRLEASVQLTATTNEGTLSPTLNYVNMVVISNSVCQASFKSAIQSVHLCTSGSSPRNTGTCEGDTGGALSIFKDDNWYIIGVSFILNDTCKFNAPPPSVYTRVSKYYAWIENTTGLNLTLEGTTIPPYTTTPDPNAGSQMFQSINYIFLVALYSTALIVMS